MLDGLRWLVGRDTMQERTSLETLIQQATGTGGSVTRPWRSSSVRQAMGVPAVYRCVSLIANTTGLLSLEVYRAGAKLQPDDTPRLAVRPDPFRAPRLFFRDTAMYEAQYGESWWWVAARDADDMPLSVLVVNPREVMVEQDPKDPRYPIITWRGRRMPNRDMRQHTLLTDPGQPLRGWGPLQACGAAVSVAVEAQEWAANFFADGGTPSIVLRSAIKLTTDEAETMRVQWVDKPHNVPRVVDPEIEEIKEFGFSPQAAQLTDVRTFQNGEVALMFGIPGTLLDHATQGVSITYQNVGQEFDKFIRSCLWPNYLEGIEQEMSDLLPRLHVARFNVDALLRADIATRFNVYNIGIPLGVIPLEEAQAAEGFAPGNVENRPVVPAAPGAVPGTLPVDSWQPVLQARSQPTPLQATTGRPDGAGGIVDVRCAGQHVVGGRLTPCGRQLGRATPPYALFCARCKSTTTSADLAPVA
jgi:HK97 family phage portal protein